MEIISKSQTSQQLLTVPTSSYISEIRSMMHAFGDCDQPLQAAAEVVEEVVKQQMREILFMACDVALRRLGSGVSSGPTMISLEDLLFLLRRSPIKVQRLMNYLAVKDAAASAVAQVANSDAAVASAAPDNKRVKKCKEFIASIDTIGTLTKATNSELYDGARTDRLKRLDRIARNLDECKYIEFAKARQVSFVGAKLKHQQKFYDWLTKDTSGWFRDFNVDKSGLEVFSYLAYDTVGQIVEMALLVRNEWDLNPDPVQRSLGAAPAFNAKYPMVQFVGERRSILNGDESPLRKRLRSGNSEAGGGSQASDTSTSKLYQHPLRPEHIREAYRRLTQLPKNPLALGGLQDGKHQGIEVSAPVISL